ncbi:DNA recombination protein RmuC [Ruania zhangjianzhongii]|uniref:DNA recombination protein RmuC n=1 Tax=Ruania zhangjianzhongii TaxID=2603206 RepID=UPI0011CC6FAF|nr:DNA recombination protein RmuC [Ruania zhangjianzhongii]
MDIIWLVVGLLIGGACGVLLARRTTGAGEPRLTAAQAEIARLAERLAAQQEAHGRALAAAERAADERTDLQQAAHERELATEQRRSAERVAELKESTQRLSDEFEALSAKVLAQTRKEFLEHAEERWTRTQRESEAELAKREEAVRHLVEPLTRTLGEVKQEMTSAEKERASAHATLTEQVNAMRSSSEHLRTETSQLVNALRAPQVRGRWGELQLRNVVESAGMVEHVDFVEQPSFTTDDGALRPDLIVTLPGEKHVVVDAKVAFNGYLEAMEAKDDQIRGKRLAAHARHVREHIDSLGAKSYWEHVPHTPEFVVMFLPAEVFLNAALEEDPTLLERAFEKNVVLATPATLVALLRTVAYTWRQERLADDAAQVFTAGRELHKRLGTLGKHLTTLGKRLNSTVEAYNSFNASLDSQLVTQARRFSALQGLEPGLSAPPPLEVLAVPAQKEDVHASAELEALVDRAAQDATRAGATSGPDADLGHSTGT